VLHLFAPKVRIFQLGACPGKACPAIPLPVRQRPALAPNKGTQVLRVVANIEQIIPPINEHNSDWTERQSYHNVIYELVIYAISLVDA
jgi:hypothetical protein